VRGIVKIMVAHNSYQQRGGEDAVREAEVSLLRAAGHEVIEFLRSNDEIRGYSFGQKLALACRTTWSRQSYRDLRDVLLWEAPDLVHFHNTFPLISPAAYYACVDAGVPVVQTLHNYRLLCPGANFLRDGRVCEECLGRSVPWPGLSHGCYRDSRVATASVAAMLTVHRFLRTWRDKVNVFIALTEFARQKHIEGGLPAERIVVKPNFLQTDPHPKVGLGDYALYIGRLSEEKGARVLIDAWSRLRVTIPLLMVGEGPLANELAEQIACHGLTSVTMLGRLANEEVLRLLHGARFLILPSVCFEGFPMTLVEAFGCGVPVIASGHGGAGEVVHDGSTGLLFTPGDSGALACKSEWAWQQAESMNEMGCAARAEFETRYTAGQNYRRLLEIYERALLRKS
jgi:glycosyltransferase involved in cell wall biosynthesis